MFQVKFCSELLITPCFKKSKKLTSVSPVDTQGPPAQPRPRRAGSCSPSQQSVNRKQVNLRAAAWVPVQCSWSTHLLCRPGARDPARGR